MRFDFVGALQAGFNSEEILDYLEKNYNDPNIQTLKEQGNSANDIIKLLAQANSAQNTQTPPKQPQNNEIAPQEAQTPPATINEPNLQTPIQEQKEQPQNIQEPLQATPITPPQEQPVLPAPKKEEKQRFSDWLTPETQKAIYEATGKDISRGRTISFDEDKKHQEILSGIKDKEFEDLNDEQKEAIDKEYGGYGDFLKNKYKFESTKKELKNKDIVDSIIENNTPFEELSDEQKKAIDDLTSTTDKIKGFFHRDKTNFENFKKEYTAHKLTPEVYDALSRLNNVSKEKTLYNAFFAKDPEVKKQYLHDVYTIAKGAGFDDVLVNDNEHKMFFSKDGVHYEVKDGFLDTITDDIASMAGETAGAISGALAGSRFGANPIQKIAGTMIGGAVGSMVGASLDYKINNWILERQDNSSELLGKLLESGAVSLVGDSALLGVIKTAHLLKKPIGLVRDQFFYQNLTAVDRTLEKMGYDKESIKNILENTNNFLDKQIPYPKSKLEKFVDAITDNGFSQSLLSAKKDKQDTAFAIAYSDPVLRHRITEVAKRDGSLQKMLIRSINDRADKLLNFTAEDSLERSELKSAIKDYQKDLSNRYSQTLSLLSDSLEGVKFSVDDVMKPVLHRLYERVDTNQSGSLLKLAQRIKDTEFDFEGLIDIRKDINAELRSEAVKKYVDKGYRYELLSAIDDKIEKGLEHASIDKDIKRKLLQQWTDINTEYKEAKAFENDSLYKKIFRDEKDATLTPEQFNKTIQDLGKSQKALADTIISKLDNRMQQRTQIAILQKNIQDFIKGEEGNRFVAFGKLQDTLEALKNKPDLKPEVKEYVNTVSDLARVFANDEAVIKGIQGGEIGINSGSIATSVISKFFMLLTKLRWDIILRQIPVIGDRHAFNYHLAQGIKRAKFSKDITLNLLEDPSPLPPSLLEELKKDIQHIKAPKNKEAFQAFYQASKELEANQKSEFLLANYDANTLKTSISAGNYAAFKQKSIDGYVTQEEIKDLLQNLSSIEPRYRDGAKVWKNGNVSASIDPDGFISLTSNNKAQKVPLEQALKEQKEKENDIQKFIQKKEELSKDLNNDITILKSAENNLRSSDDNIGSEQALEGISTSGISDVASNGYRGREAPRSGGEIQRGSGEIHHTTRKDDGKRGSLESGDGSTAKLGGTLEHSDASGGSRRAGTLSESPYTDEKTSEQSLQTSQAGIRGREYAQSDGSNVEREETHRLLKDSLEVHPTTNTLTFSDIGNDTLSTELQNLTKDLSQKNQPLKDFGTNYPEYYHDGKGAIEKLLATKEGQVQGAFHRPDIGDITLVWGKEGTGSSDGFGLAKIVKFHPEVIDKLETLVDTLPIVKESPNRYQLENKDYKIAIRKEFEGNKENWILTAFEKEDNSVSSRTDFENTLIKATDKTTPVRDEKNSTTPALKNQPKLTLELLKNKKEELTHAIKDIKELSQKEYEEALTKFGINDLENALNVQDYLKNDKDIWQYFKLKNSLLAIKKLLAEKLSNDIAKREVIKLSRHYDDYKPILLDTGHKYTIDVLKTKVGEPLSELNNDEIAILRHFYQTGKKGFENFQYADKLNKEALFKEYDHLKNKFQNFKAEAFFNEIFGELEEKRPSSVAKSYDNLVRNFKYYIKNRKHHNGYPVDDEMLQRYTRILEMLQDKEVENFVKKSNRDILKALEFKDRIQNELQKHQTQNPHSSDTEYLQSLQERYQELADKLFDTQANNQALKDFGTNYPEYYHDGKGAIEKLLATKEGQVQGAFYRPDIGDITLVWGKEGTGRSDGFGLAKIVKFHPEVIDKLETLVDTLPIVKESPNRYQLENKDYKIAIRKEFEGNKENWILTAFEKEDNSVSSRTDFENTLIKATDKTTPVRDEKNSTTPELKNQLPKEQKPPKYTEEIKRLEEEIKDFQEHLQKEERIIQWNTGKDPKGDEPTILETKKWIQTYQDILYSYKISDALSSKDLQEAYDVYGGVTRNFKHDTTQKEYPHQTISTHKASDILESQNPKELKEFDNYIKAHTDPFGISFTKEGGLQGEEAIKTLLTYKLGQVKNAFHKEGLGDIDLVWGNEKMGLAHILEKHPEVVEKIPEIIERGEVIKNGEFETIILKDEGLYKVGLSKGWNGTGENNWIITAYEDTRLPHSDLLPSNGVASRDVLLSNNLSDNSTTPEVKNQTLYQNIQALKEDDPEAYRLLLPIVNDLNLNAPNSYESLLKSIQDTSAKLPQEILNALHNPQVKEILQNVDNETKKIIELTADIEKTKKEIVDLTARLHTYENTTSAQNAQELLALSKKNLQYYQRDLQDLLHKEQARDNTIPQELSLQVLKDTIDTGTPTQATQDALQKEGFKIEETITPEGKQGFEIYPPTQSVDVDSPLPQSNTPIVYVVKNTFKEFDAQGKELKEIKVSDGVITEKKTQGDVALTTAYDTHTNTQNVHIQIKNTELPSPLKNNLPSNATLSKERVALQEGFVIDPNSEQKISFENNIKAIKTLKELQKSGNLATQEQKEILNAYVGWGGLANKFNEGTPSDALLKELLSQDEYNSIKASTLSAYYTPYFVVDGIWKALYEMGFRGGNILEPSIGVGNFLGLMPKEIRQNSIISGVEKDPITASIAKHLYPNASIMNTGFEEVNFKKGVDLIIGNPPYGDFKVYDKNFKKESAYTIHNYFLLKSLRLLNPDGVMAQVVTTNFLDNKNPSVREALFKEAELLFAIRLPQNAFKDTATATDIVFLRKLKSTQKNPNTNWLNLKTIPDPMGKEDIPINEYFYNNPEHILGTVARYGGQYGEDTVGVRKNGDTTLQLSHLLQNLSEKTHINTPAITSKADLEASTKYNGITPEVSLEYAKNNSLIAHDGKFYRVSMDADYRGFEPIDELELIGKTQAEYNTLTPKGKEQKQAWINKFKEMFPDIIAIRDALFELKNAQLSVEFSKPQIDALRAKLGKNYDSFYKKYGMRLNDSKIATAFDADPTYPHLAALEKYTQKDGKQIFSAKADIFSKRTQYPYIAPTKADSLEDARTISLQEVARLDFARIASLLNKDEDSIKNEFLNKKLGFMDAFGEIHDAPSFLSGNIRQKLAEFEGKTLNNFQNQSRQALIEVLPKDIDISDIHIGLGLNYIPEEVYKDFATQILGASNPRISYVKSSDQWISDFKASLSADSNFGVQGEYKIVGAADIFDSVMNQTRINMSKTSITTAGEEIVLKDPKGDSALQLAKASMQESFSDFVLSNPKHANKIQEIYNDLFNSYVTPKYDGSHLQLLGKNDLITLRPHQKNAIWRSVISKSTLLDHTVGTGKTYTMVATAMELRRLGLANKPLFIVPNHIVAQFGREFQNLYPNATLLITQKFDAKSRQKTLSSIALGDWDAVIIGHSNATMLPMDKMFEVKFMQEQLQAINTELAEAKKNNERLTTKNLENALAKQQEKLKRLLDSKKDNTINFEELGIDALFVDEAHEFKNLAFYTRQDIRGLGNPAGSQKASDLFMKTRFLKENNKKIVFATGTPIANSVAELYTMQRFLDYEGLKAVGMERFDAWSRSFAKISTEYEMGVSGKYKPVERIRGYVNLPELLSQYHQFADTILNDDVQAMLKAEGKELDLPKANFINQIAEKSPEQTSYMQSILSRGNDIESGQVKPQEDNMLKITTDAQKASLDMRLIDPYAIDYEGSKINLSIKNILKEYKDYAQDRGTQLVFIDRSTPKSKRKNAKEELQTLLEKIEQGDKDAELALERLGGQEYVESLQNEFNVYEDIKQKLIKAGIPENEIAFIHDYNDAKAKQNLFSKVNSGEVRILLGSSGKMGAGTNVQERIVAVHHIDAPWRPADIEQRNGRAIRQGNKLYEKYGKDKFKVNIYTYATKDMLDTVMFEKLNTKATFINQLRSGNFKGREIEDIGDTSLNFAEIQAGATGDKRILQKLNLEKEITTLSAQKNNIQKLNLNTTRLIDKMERLIKEKPDEIKAYEENYQAFKKGGGVINIAGKIYTRGEKDLSEALSHIRPSKDNPIIYAYNGFKIEAKKIASGTDWGNYQIIAHSPINEEVYAIATIKPESFSPTGILTRLENYFNPDRLKSMNAELEHTKTELPKLKKTLKGFKDDALLKEKIEALNKLNAELFGDMNTNNGFVQSHPYAGFGILGGIVGGGMGDEDSNNPEFNALLGVLGAIVGVRALKYLQSKPEVLQRVLKHHFPEKKDIIDAGLQKQLKKEKRGIYNVAYNNKKSTLIKQDLDSIENAILFEKGRENPNIKRGIGYGATHINARHTNPKDLGYITQEEYLNLGHSIREYLKKHQAPYIDKNGSRIYEWKDKNGIGFRVVVGNRGKDASYMEKHHNDLSSPKRIITFYSDRNLKHKMQFKNPALKG